MMPSQRRKLGSAKDSPMKTVDLDIHVSKKVDDCSARALTRSCITMIYKLKSSETLFSEAAELTNEPDLALIRGNP